MTLNFMKNVLNPKTFGFLAFLLTITASFSLGAQEEVPAVSPEVAYILNTFL